MTYSRALPPINTFGSPSRETRLLLTYLGLLQLEHRPSTIPLQHTRFWAASHAPFQLSFWALSSASVSRLQLLQGRPLLRFLWGFQLRACRVMLAGGFLSVWPIQPHFLWRICLASGSCPARSHKSVLLILSGHRMPRIRRRQVLAKHWIFWCNALVVRHVSHPYSNTGLTLELKILGLVKRGSPSLKFYAPSRETRLANKRLECESTIGR